MVESEASGLTEQEMLGAVKFGHEKFVPIIKAIENLAKKAGKPKWEVEIKDYKEVKNSLNKSFITKDISLSSYNNNEVEFKVEISGTEEDFKSDFASLLAFNFLEESDEYIKYRYIND